MDFNILNAARETQSLRTKPQTHDRDERDALLAVSNRDQQRAARGRRILSPALLAQILTAGATAESDRELCAFGRSACI